MNSLSIHLYDHVTLRPLNELATLHEFDITIQVVPAYEADADNDLISEDAPLGRAVLGSKPGEKVTIQVQGRSLSMLILAVGKRHAVLAE
ncbi:MAG: Transcription elongation factor, GreA/GreB, C-term [Prosthecobacter sp.]|nr:Transcription elongation factor, GreA/GreB, C-term [Prosthecobacter sp.]